MYYTILTSEVLFYLYIVQHLVRTWTWNGTAGSGWNWEAENATPKSVFPESVHYGTLSVGTLEIVK